MKIPFRTKLKYGNKKVTIDGITFHSKAEGARYQELKLLMKAKKIKGLTLQPKFVLQEPFKDNQGRKHRAIVYVADFMYLNKKGEKIVEDVKGVRTLIYVTKMKLFLHKFKDILFFEALPRLFRKL